MNKWRFGFFIAVVLAILMLAHFVVYEGLALVFMFSKNTFVILRLLIFLLPAWFVASLVYASRKNNFFSKLFYRFIAYWLGFLLYLFLASFVLAAISWLPVNLFWLGRSLFLFAVLTAVYGIYHARQIRHTKVSVKLPNLPQFWIDKKIVFVSDLHLGQIQGQKFAEKVVAEIRKINPDLIFIGGDLYDGVAADRQQIISSFKNLDPSLGIYFITGNHDGFTEKSTQEDIAAIESTGIRVLQDEVRVIEGLQIAGVGYRESTNREKFGQILNKIELAPNQPSVLLKHVPDNLDLAAAKGFSLVLCGHTHRAQMWPLSFLPKLIYKNLDYGLKNLESTKIFTSSGVGTWGPPFRVGTNSEIVILTLS